MINKKLRFSFEVFSPIHIGSGEKYIKGIDFVELDGKVIIYNNLKLLEMLKEDDLARATDINFLEKLVKEILQRPEGKSFIIAEYSGRTKNEIFPFIRDSFMKPLIPGTSIKGSIRTAIIKHIVEEEKLNIRQLLSEKLRKDPKRVRKNLDSPVIKEALRNGHDNAHFDVMRFLKTEDIYFENRDLILYKINIKTKKRGGAQFVKGLELYAEMLRPGVKKEFELKIEEASFRDERVRAKLNLDKYEKYFIDLTSVLKNFYERWIKKEIEELKKLEIVEIIDFYHELLKKLKEGYIPFHLGFGSGWRGMTGDLLDASLKEQIVRKFRLTKSSQRPFPVSRKLVEIQKGLYAPPGWALLRVEGGGK